MSLSWAGRRQALQTERDRRGAPIGRRGGEPGANGETVRRLGAALLRGNRRAVRRSAAGGLRATKTGAPHHVSPVVRATSAFPTRGNSRNPSPSFCSPVIGPLNLNSAAAGARLAPKPCTGRWNVPSLG